MQNLSKIATSIFYFLVLIIIKINAEDNTIKVLINKPDINSEQYLEKYNSLINQYFVSEDLFNKINIPPINITFAYCSPVQNDGLNLERYYKIFNKNLIVDVEYARKLNCTLRELKNSNYDLMIVDDSFLFVDKTSVKNPWVSNFFSNVEIQTFYLNFDQYKLNKTDISHHYEKIFDDGYNEGQYGLPYELDFDVLYNQKLSNNMKSLKLEKRILNNIKSVGLLSKILNEKHISRSLKSDNVNDHMDIGLSDNDDLMNSLVEFIKNHLNIEENKDSKYFTKFYTDEVYSSFKDYLMEKTGVSLNETLNTSVEDIYQSFISGKTKVFKGKASYLHELKELKNITVSIKNMPKNYTVVKEKYVIINKNTKKDKDLLVRIALQLTSKKMQLYRAKHFGSIPTFDLDKVNNDEERHQYCSTNSDICDLLQEIRPINIKKAIRKNKFSGSYLEARIILPSTLREILLTNNYTTIIGAFLATNESMPFMAYFFGNNLYLVITLAVTIIIVEIILITVVILLLKNKNHSHLKPISPTLSSLSILGMSMNILYPILYFFLYSNTLCRISYIFKLFIGNMILLPIFVIIFRIFYIYNNVSKVYIGKKINDRYLIKYIVIILVTCFSCSIIYISFNKIIILTSGSLFPHRYLFCTFINTESYRIVYNIYYIIFVIAILVMLVETIKVSKKYSLLKYAYFIVIYYVSTYIYDTYTYNYNYREYILLTFSISCIYTLSCLCCIYLLVGPQLINILKKKKDKSTIDEENNIDNINIVDFIPSVNEVSFNRTVSFVRDKSKNNIFEEDDPIANNPNNYFFNKTLQRLSSQQQQQQQQQEDYEINGSKEFILTKKDLNKFIN